MKHTEHYTVKWHDTDANRRVRPSMILTYMQETANLQLKANGVDLDTLRDEQGLAFLLSRITIRNYQPLYAYDEIDVETWICDSRGFSFNRCFRILRGGEVIAEAFSVWALMNLREMKLVRAEDFRYGFEGDEPLTIDYPKRVHFPPTLAVETVGERTIRYSDIDYNGHMNNTRYPDMLCDFLQDVCQKTVVGMTLSYLHEATFGHTLRVLHAQTPEGDLFRTVDGDTVCLEALLTAVPTDETEERNRT